MLLKYTKLLGPIGKFSFEMKQDKFASCFKDCARVSYEMVVVEHCIKQCNRKKIIAHPKAKIGKNIIN